MQNKLSLLKDQEQQKQREKITEAINDYRETERKIYLDLKKERDEKMKEIIEDINKIIRNYAEENGFDVIVNENAILYGSKNMDITEDILKLVNKKYR